MHIPMLDLKLEYAYMKADIDTAIQRCLDHQQWILGPGSEGIEDKVAEYLGVKHCVGASSGTDALVLASVPLLSRPRSRNTLIVQTLLSQRLLLLRLPAMLSSAPVLHLSSSTLISLL